MTKYKVTTPDYCDTTFNPEAVLEWYESYTAKFKDLNDLPGNARVGFILGTDPAGNGTRSGGAMVAGFADENGLYTRLSKKETGNLLRVFGGLPVAWLNASAVEDLTDTVHILVESYVTDGGEEYIVYLYGETMHLDRTSVYTRVLDYNGVDGCWEDEEEADEFDFRKAADECPDVWVKPQGLVKSLMSTWYTVCHKMLWPPKEGAWLAAVGIRRDGTLAYMLKDGTEGTSTNADFPTDFVSDNIVEVSVENALGCIDGLKALSSLSPDKEYTEFGQLKLTKVEGGFKVTLGKWEGEPLVNEARKLY